MRDAPQGIRFHRSTNELEVDWGDGDVRRLPAWDLRCQCRCAECVDEVTGQRVLNPASVPKGVSVAKMDLIGSYSVRFTFSDGHANGLFTWDHLDELTHAAP